MNDDRRVHLALMEIYDQNDPQRRAINKQMNAPSRWPPAEVPSTGDPVFDGLLEDLCGSTSTYGSLAAADAYAHPAKCSSTAEPTEAADVEIVVPAPISAPATTASPSVSAAPITSTAATAPVTTTAPERELLTTSSTLDRFPVAALHDVPEFIDPGREVAALCREVRESNDYLAARDRYCVISIRMNLDGLFAPAFRHRPRVQAPNNDSIHMQMHRDRLVIDYHWCHATGMQLSPTDPDHAHLLDLEHDFDFAEAWSLAQRNQFGKYRAAEALCLTPLHQCQTMTLHGLELKARLEQIHKTYRNSKGAARGPFAKAITAIGQWAERNKRIEAERVSYEKLWLARAMLGEDGTDQAIAALHALMLGKSPLYRKTIAGKLATLKRNVDVALKPTTTP